MIPAGANRYSNSAPAFKVSNERVKVREIDEPIHVPIRAAFTRRKRRDEQHHVRFIEHAILVQIRKR